MSFYKKGVELLTQGAQNDEAKKYHEAVLDYSRGIEYILAGVKYEKNNVAKKAWTTKVIQFMERAEQLQTFLKEEETQKAATSASTSKSNEKGKEKDEEHSKLRSAIESAIVSEKPHVKWEDVVGLDTAKKALEEAIVLPQKYPQLFVGKRQPWKAVLLYGPPGTGKSYLAKAAATMVNATFFSISSADLVSKYLGESEKLVRELFAVAAEKAPSIIFIDEIDAICSKRSSEDNESFRRIKNEMLLRMQEVAEKSGVFVLAATNRPYDLDSALRRRFDKRIYIPLPDKEARKQMLKVNIGDENLSHISKRDLEEFASKTESYSAADISIVSRDALMEPVRKALHAQYFRELEDGSIVPCTERDAGAKQMNLFDIKDPEKLKIGGITVHDLLKSLSRTKASVGKEELKEHERFTEEFGEGEMGAKQAKATSISKSTTQKAPEKQTVQPIIVSDSSDEDEYSSEDERKPQAA